SIDALLAMLRERRAKILATYDPRPADRAAKQAWLKALQTTKVPRAQQTRFEAAIRYEQLYQLERLWYAQQNDTSPFARQILQLMERLGERYEIDELISSYEFTGTQPLDVPQALDVKEELERIDELIEQLLKAKETAQIAVVDLDALAEFAEPGDLEQLKALRQQVEQLMREQAEQQGLNLDADGLRLTPQSYRIFQAKLLERIFSKLQPSRTGRHDNSVEGDGAVELTATKPYEFGDSITQMDIPQTLINAMLRQGQSLPIRLRPEDIEVHRTRNSPKCATVVIMDMSGSMRYDAQYVNVKRMALALEGLIHREYPGDFLRFLEMYTFAKPVAAGDIIDLMPKPVTLFDPVVQLRADMGSGDVTESMVHPHFTNIQHALQLARRQLATQDTPNRQVVLITDGLPTAHFEAEWLYLLYPPHPRTEEVTMREGQLCAREGITINLFLIPSWSQSEEDIRFAHRLAEATQGRVFFTAGRDLDRFVLWDYVERKREILG
ncbi:MAG: VWA domain-containing protein, partial [Planctomycetales bacterium]|nr:VWA domain-containing protein [Planctomycetales bacterium]